VTYHVVIHRRAEAGITEAYDWLAERSPEAAERWLAGVQRAIASLDTLPARCPIAPESRLVGSEIRCRLYGRRGGRYRILFVIRGESVHVVDVRHGARRPIAARDLQLPADEERDSGALDEPEDE
jgi:plasmid stabilization system protein ParE